MVDYNELKKRFKAKGSKCGASRGPMHSKSSKAAVKAISREYELKMLELRGSGMPLLKKGPLFYVLAVVVLMVVGGLVLSAAKNGFSISPTQADKANRKARSSVDALTIALGRYKFHVGDYPSTEEGLAVLNYRRPAELKMIRARHPTWNGPYVKQIACDPWGNEYVYETREEGGNPVLYSKGPDGRAGTTDDVLPNQEYFELPFRDTSWTNRWCPCELRGIVLAPDRQTQRKVEMEMRQYDK